MDGQWYIARDQQKSGPFTWTQLQQFASAGDLLPTDCLWKEGMSQWAPATNAPGLFPNTRNSLPTASSAQHFPPIESRPAANSAADSTQSRQSPRKNKRNLGSQAGLIVFGVVALVLFIRLVSTRTDVLSTRTESYTDKNMPKLVGKSPAEVQEMLGKPDFLHSSGYLGRIRYDECWAYDHVISHSTTGKRLTLDVYFTDDVVFSISRR